MNWTETATELLLINADLRTKPNLSLEFHS